MTLTDLITRDRTPALHAILHRYGISVGRMEHRFEQARAELLAALEAARKLGATPEPVLTPQGLYVLLDVSLGRTLSTEPTLMRSALVDMGLLTMRVDGGLCEYSLTDAGRARVAWACGGTR